MYHVLLLLRPQGATAKLSLKGVPRQRVLIFFSKAEAGLATVGVVACVMREEINARVRNGTQRTKSSIRVLKEEEKMQFRADLRVKKCQPPL